MPDFNRTRLKHHMPPWVKNGEVYFITINCKLRGSNTLTCPGSAKAIKASIQHYTNIHKWHPRLVVLMLDHLHALLSLSTAHYTITQIISPWKRYVKRTQDINWQSGFFEHRIRNQASLEEKADYLRQNPVRAQLVEHPEQWPYLWDISDFQR